MRDLGPSRVVGSERGRNGTSSAGQCDESCRAWTFAEAVSGNTSSVERPWYRVDFNV